MLDAAISQPRQFVPVRSLLCKPHRACQQVALDDQVEQASVCQFFGAYDSAGYDHVERCLEADGPREALRPPCSRKNAELHFR